MPETNYEKNLREFQERLRSGSLDASDEKRIYSFIKKYPSKHWTREQVIKACKQNEKLCAKMAIEPGRQNLTEAPTIQKIGAEKLPSSGKNNIRFSLLDGGLVLGQKADYNHTKSADFVMIYKGQKIYGAQKTIHGQGGAQSNQIRDAVLFAKAGNIKHKAIAVVDGAIVDEPDVYTSDEVVRKKSNNEDF
ncbi:MAG: hypothetical protein FWC83_01125 [Alphaproteobacteria bacterium]|nr:hypothetical protein [Alphaproteobacteria bacterium]